MKKSITLSALVLCLSVSATAQVRKTWDFTGGWGAITVANLKADAAKGSSWTNKSSTKAPVYYESLARTAGPLTATVNGATIVLPETKGLTFTTVSKEHLNIYTDAAGQSYLWINGAKEEDRITIPKVAKGEKIVIDYETHKSGSARGFKSITNNFVDANDASISSWTTSSRDTAYIINNNDDSTDYVIQSTSGFHIYSIVVGSGDDPDAFKTKVGYVYSGDLTKEDAYNTIKSNSSYSITPLDASTTLTAAQLKGYDVDVISSTLGTDNANVTTIKEAFPFVPTLNLNANLYEKWGYGTAVEAGQFAAPKDVSKPIYTLRTIPSLSLQDENDTTSWAFLISEKSNYTGVKLGSYFIHDDTLATDLENKSIIAIHEHNISHNGYMYMPFTKDLTNELLFNGIDILASSKAAITATETPTYKVHYGDRNATVTINSKVPYAQIFYTTDGSEPTTDKATPYTESINLTKETTVKAIALGDGYTTSLVADTLIKMYDQIAAPTFKVKEADDAATIQLASTTPGVKIWYNFSNVADTTQSKEYTKEIVLNDHAILYAFATGTNYVPSEISKEEIYVQNDKVFIDQVSHFDANKTYGGTNNQGMFSWGTTPLSDTDENNVTGMSTDADGNQTITYGARAVAMFPADTTGLNIDWVLKSQGQSMIWQNLTPGTTVGESSAYNPATADDLDTLVSATSNNIQFYKMYGTQSNARIESKKIQGPFNIITFVGTASGSEHKLNVEVSADGNTWTQLGDTIDFKVAKRLYKKFIFGYRGTDEVSVRLIQTGGSVGAQCYDIYIMKEGEKSLEKEKVLAEEGKAYLDQITGITTVNTTNSNKVASIYNINGIRQNKLQRGINIVKYTDGSVKKVILK